MFKSVFFKSPAGLGGWLLAFSLASSLTWTCAGPAFCSPLSGGTVGASPCCADAGGTAGELLALNAQPGVAAINSRMRHVESLRKLRFKQNLSVKYVSADEMIPYLRNDQDAPSAGVRVSRDCFLASLGVMPAGASYYKVVREGYAKGARDVYSQRSGVLLLLNNARDPKAFNFHLSGKIGRMAENMGVDLAEIYSEHELVRALLDQEYGVKPYGASTWDEELALRAVAEGNALEVAVEALNDKISLGSARIVDYALSNPAKLEGFLNQYTHLSSLSVPAREVFLMPYYEGLSLVHFLRRRGGSDSLNYDWAMANRSLFSLPEGTSQILHPVTYMKFIQSSREDREAEKKQWSSFKVGGDLLPDRLTVKGESPQYWMAGPRDRAGEFMVRVLGRRFLKRNEAAKMAAGWCDDAWRVYYSPDYLRADQQRVDRLNELTANGSGATDKDKAAELEYAQVWQGKGQDCFVVWLSSWKSEEYARSFETLAGKLVEQQKSLGAGGCFCLRQGQRVALVLGAPASFKEADLPWNKAVAALQ